jgi:DNA-binding transcriptional MerR regulator
MPSMNLRLPIGDFARMTHLSVKALRHYHDLGVLAPAEIDPDSGYRFYELEQVPVAQVIRRFRDLGMPLDEVRAVLQAPDVASRNEVIVAHLARMESQLAQTQSTVASLRSLLETPPPTTIAVEHRAVPATPALAITERVAEADVPQWWAGAFGELFATLRSAGVSPAGPSGSLYSGDLFEAEIGEVVAFVPVPRPVQVDGRPGMIEVPPAELAVALHRGSFGDLDQTYAPLGAYVSERELGVEGPIREYYLVTPADTDDESQHRTEVGWPIFRTSAA